MPTAVELRYPNAKTEKGKWRYQDLVCPAQEYGTIVGFDEKDHYVCYIIRCTQDDSRAVISKVKPIAITSGSMLNHMLVEKGSVRDLAVLRKGEAYRELIRFEPGARKKLVRFLHL